MAVLIEGLQGSGKSYYATYKMHHDRDKYDKIFTNIDGIKVTDRIKQLSFKKFTLEILDECYNISVLKDGSFEDVISFLKKMYILPSNPSKENRVLFVIDEAQNYFGKTSKNSPSLEWFITQHRHLFIELYLITQKHVLLRDNYKLFNLTYLAYPPVKQFSKSKIKYKEYAGLSSSEVNFVRTFSLAKEKEVFDMYVSGDKVESPNILKRFLLLGAMAMIAIFATLYMFTSKYSTKEEIATPTNKEALTDQVKKVAIKYTSDTKLYEFVVWDDGTFYVRGLNEHDSKPIKLLLYIKESFFVTVIDKEDMGHGMTLIYVVCSKGLTDFLKVENDDKESGISSFELSDYVS